MTPVTRDRLRSLGIAALIAVAALIAGRQITLDGGYAAHPMYRAQVDALLDGRLALSTAPDSLVHDLAWTPSGAQQVWGLGAPLWQLPFELLGRAIGWTPFPDRVALAAWLTLVVFAMIRAFRPRAVGELRPGEQRSDQGRTRALDSRAMQIGAVLSTALLPSLVSVLRGRIGVYEEAAIYAYGAALLLLGGLVSTSRTPTTARYLVLLACAGLSGMIRPTVWFYGLATAIIASAMLVRRRGRPALTVVALGLALFVAGGGVLYATNAHRFGRGSEFGHRLNLHSLPGNIVATRFSYPFERAGLVEASAELVGGMFDGPERTRVRGFYHSHLHAGQSPLPRWREFYFTVFSWPYLAAILAGLVLAGLAWRRHGDALVRTLGAWAVLGGAPLIVFYLRAPSMTSRYQLDFAPAIAALLVIVWRAGVVRWPRAAIATLVAAWSIAVATSRITRPKQVSDPLDRAAAARTSYAISRAVAAPRTLPPAYDAADPALAGVLSPAPTALYLNGFGWNRDTLRVPPATLFFVEDPARITLDVSGPPGTDWSRAVRVAIGLTHLPLAEVTPAPGGARLRFERTPPAPALRGLQVAFLAFGPDTGLDRSESDFGLRSIRWRD